MSAGAWDDRNAHLSTDFGGSCTTAQEASKAALSSQWDVVTVQLTHGGNLAGFAQDVGAPVRDTIRCIRRRDEPHLLIKPFTRACAEDIDLPLLEEYHAQVRTSNPKAFG